MDKLFPSSTNEEPMSAGKKPKDETLKQKTILNVPVSTCIKHLINLFSVPRIRRATTAAAVVMVSQQLCGLNVIGFYCGTLLPQPDRDNTASVRSSNRNGLWLGWGSWMIGMLYIFIALHEYIS